MELIAIVVGPIAAVAITLWYQGRSRHYQQRFDTFKTLVIYRRHGLSADFVNALNLVPVIFHKDKDVLAARHRLMECFEDTGWQSKNEEVFKAIVDRTETRIAELIREIGKTVRVSINDIEVLKGAYSPRGWATVEQQNQRARTATLELLEGQRALTIRLEDSAQRDTRTPPLNPDLQSEIARLLTSGSINKKS